MVNITLLNVLLRGVIIESPIKMDYFVTYASDAKI